MQIKCNKWISIPFYIVSDSLLGYITHSKSCKANRVGASAVQLKIKH